MTDPVHAAAAFLRAHTREPVTLADVADAVGYSPFHVSRLFTARIRMSPMRYLAGHRFHLAKHLLLTEGLTVVDACHEVGFSSPGTFTRRFREHVGIAPGELRRLADESGEPGADRPFGLTVGPAGGGCVTGRVVLPPRSVVGPAPLVWVGLFARPEPSGIPGAGALRRGECDFRLDVVPGFPWLFVTVMPEASDPIRRLADPEPLVAAHPAPITEPADVTVVVRSAHEWEPPILTVLPALRKIGVS